MKLKEWLHFDAKDLKADYLLCIDQYIEYEIDSELKEIASLHYYEKKKRQEIAKELKKGESEVSEKLEKIRNYLYIALTNKGWELPSSLEELKQIMKDNQRRWK